MSRDARDAEEPVERLAEHGFVHGVIENHRRGGDGGAPHDGEEIRVVQARLLHLGDGHHASAPALRLAHHVGPSRGRERGRGVVGEFDLVLDDAAEDVLERLARPIRTAVGAAVVADELVQGHLALHLRVVLIGVEHDDGVRQDVRRVRVRHRARVGAVIARGENLQNARNLLRLAGEFEPVQERAQRLIQGDPAEVEDAAVLGQHLDVEILVIAEVLAHHLLIQTRRVLEKPRHSRRLERIRQELDLLHVRQSLLVRSVEVIRARQQSALDATVASQRPRARDASCLRLSRAPGCESIPNLAANLLLPVVVRVGVGGRLPRGRDGGGSIGDAGGDGEQTLQGQEVRGVERGAVLRERASAEQTDEFLEEVGPLDVAVEIHVQVRHERGLAAQVHDALEGDALGLLRDLPATLREGKQHHAQERLQLQLELQVHHHVQLQHRRRDSREHRRMPRGRHRQDRPRQLVLHQTKQRRVPREVIPGGLERREHQLQTERAHRLRVFVAAVLEADERRGKSENLQHARQAEGLTVRRGVRRERRALPRGVGFRAGALRGTLRRGSVVRRSGIRGGAGILGGDGVIRGGILRGGFGFGCVDRFFGMRLEVGRGTWGVDVMGVSLRERGEGGESAKRFVDDLAEDVPGEVAQEGALLAALVSDTITRLHDVADVVVGEEASGGAAHALEEDVEDLGEDHVVVVRVGGLEPAEGDGVRHRVHRLGRVGVLLADQAVLKHLEHRAERHPAGGGGERRAGRGENARAFSERRGPRRL